MRSWELKGSTVVQVHDDKLPGCCEDKNVDMLCLSAMTMFTVDCVHVDEDVFQQRCSQEN